MTKNDLIALVAKKAASILTDEIKRKPNLTLGIASGKTMIPFYRELVKLHKKKKISFSRIKCFMLDEYSGLGGLKQFISKSFISKVDVKRENFNFLDGKSGNFNLECERYEKAIKKAGGIDLQILGIGRNGHIAFNEPGSGFQSLTRKVNLSESTIRDNGKIPKTALTMGIKTIMKARKIILLAIGESKAEAVNGAIRGGISENLPASVLQKHRNTVFILDKQAGRLLS